MVDLVVNLVRLKELEVLMNIFAELDEDVAEGAKFERSQTGHLTFVITRQALSMTVEASPFRVNTHIQYGPNTFYHREWPVEPNEVARYIESNVPCAG